jgi:hypothetical protein
MKPTRKPSANPGRWLNLLEMKLFKRLTLFKVAKLQDELLDINVRTEIELGADAVTVLTAEGLL